MLLCNNRSPVMRSPPCHGMAGSTICVGVEGDAPFGGRTLSDPPREKVKVMFDTVVKKLRSYSKYQETYRELSRLSARELNDLGISRADIPYIARRAAQ
jgi:uncharacterized protein YjiS (DUF1127 family)